MTDLITFAEKAFSTDPLVLALCISLVLSLALLRNGK